MPLKQGLLGECGPTFTSAKLPQSKAEFTSISKCRTRHELLAISVQKKTLTLRSGFFRGPKV